MADPDGPNDIALRRILDAARYAENR